MFFSGKINSNIFIQIPTGLLTSTVSCPAYYYQYSQCEQNDLPIWHFIFHAVLIVTDSSQNNYIAKGMTKTAIRGLGYLPYQSLKKLNEQETEFYPTVNSLQPYPYDPPDS